MTKIELKLIDDSKVSKTLSWGVHKELSNYLMVDGRLMTMFTDTDITEEILQICLSERDTYGEVKSPFVKSNQLDVDSMIKFLSDLHEYFEDFFFQNQQRVAKMEQKFKSLQQKQTTEV